MDADISAYVHIPFCSSRCSYCSFYFETGFSSAIIRDVLDRTIVEAQSSMTNLGTPRVRTLYFGGGTPSVIPPDILNSYLPKLLKALNCSNNLPLHEIDFEANPESLSPGRLEALIKHSLNCSQTLRISLGIQSFSETVLHTLGRRARMQDIENAISLLQQNKANLRFNLDLIYGVPGQSMSVFREDLHRCIDSGAAGISLYELTIENGTALQQSIQRGDIPAPSSLHSDELWECALDTLESAGYRNYEVSNFALPGQESKHNFAYWHLRPYLGLGPGGVSTLPTRDNNAHSHVQRTENPDIYEYRRINFNGEVVRQNTENIGPSELFTEIFITGLRTISGVSISALKSMFGNTGELLARRLQAEWSKKCIAHSSRIILKPEYRYTMDKLLPSVMHAAGKLQTLTKSEWSWPPALRHPTCLILQ